MHSLLGRDWHLVVVNHYLQEFNNNWRDGMRTRSEWPLFGDSIEELQVHWWQDICKAFDEKRAGAAKALVAMVAA